MTLLYMSLTGGIIIALTALLRRLNLDILPKRCLRIIWLLAAVRLLVPLSFEVKLPADLIQLQQVSQPEPEIQHIPQPNQRHTDYRYFQAIDGEMLNKPWLNEPSQTKTEISSTKAAVIAITAVYFVGAAAVFVFFLFADRRIRQRLSKARKIDDERCNVHINCLMRRLKVNRKVQLKTADVASPLTVGLFKPVIILPTEYTELDGEALDCILAHELIHIRRYDVVCKRLFCFAACLHWFNPLVWVMLDLASRDIELACDESVLRQIEDRRDVYALCLIEAEEMRMPLVESFGGSAISERIKCIMNAKKFTAAGSAVIALLLAGTSMMFVRAVPAEDINSAGAPDVSTPTKTVAVEWKKEDSTITEPPGTEVPEIHESDEIKTAELVFTFPLAASVSDIVISNDYGERMNPLSKKVIFHDGIDIPQERGTDILAAAGGIVEKAEYNASNGNYVIIDHCNGVKTIYMHCSELVVKEGDSVAAGQVIAKVGATGMATGNHLHFGVMKDGEYVDPFDYFAD
ncbi:MAG: peptidoglycan DD-metalloendopeptidase family protein [Clostridiales bacterium]|nr:peptidoglycan DD-metalloendopeptidase family protein [Clostridiales bacterium]